MVSRHLDANRTFNFGRGGGHNVSIPSTANLVETRSTHDHWSFLPLAQALLKRCCTPCWKSLNAMPCPHSSSARPGRRVELDRISGVEGKLVQRFLEAGAEMLVFDLTHLAILPTFFVTSRGPHDLGLLPSMPMAGQGTHPSSRLALRRALLEAAQSRAVAIQGSREDLVRHASDWQDDRALSAEWEQMSRTPSAAISLGMEANSSCTIGEALLHVCKMLAMRGVADVAISVLPVPVEELFAVHVVVPGLVDRLSDPQRITPATEPFPQSQS